MDKIQYFPGKIWKTKPLGWVSLDYIAESISHPKEGIKKVFNEIAKAEKEEDWERKGLLKQNNLFYFTPCVTLDGEGRSYKNITGFTGYMVLDFDHLKGSAESFRDSLFNKLKSVKMCFVSPSKKGVKAIIKIPVVKTVDEFKEYFYGMGYYLEHMRTFDPTGQNPVLPLFISWDENIKYRGNPETWGVRGGKHGFDIEVDEDFEPVKGTEEDRKSIYRILHSVIRKADEDHIGNPKVNKCALMAGNYVSGGYITKDEARKKIHVWIDESEYLSKKSDTYKHNAETALLKGMYSPTILNVGYKRRNKPEKTYYLLCKNCYYDGFK